MIHGHGGNIYAMAKQMGCPPEEILDMSSNINPLGMPPGLQEYLHGQLHRIGVLPEPDAQGAISQMAELLGVDAGRIVAGNGTTQFIYAACPALDSQKVLIVGPTYSDYADACSMHHVPADHFLAGADEAFAVDLGSIGEMVDAYDTVMICNPNNPTGRLIPHHRLQRFCLEHPKIHFVIDESYLPFAAGGDSRSMMAEQPDNVSVLWSLSKIFGVPGLRAGFLISGQAVRSPFLRLMQPWSLNALAQAAVDFLGSRQVTVREFMGETQRFIASERRKFSDAIASGSKVTPFPSQASYLLLKLPEGMVSHQVCSKMAQKRILIRNCRNFHGLSEQYVRVALKDEKTNQLALESLMEIMDQAAVSD